jgi:cutinase
MKITLLLAALSALALAVPAPKDAVVLDLEGLGPDTKDNVANDVVENKPCKAITLIFARGTTEPGNIGMLVGPAVKTQLERAFPGQVNTQGVKYPASIGGYLARGDKAGGMLMAKLAMQAHKQCPNSHIVLSGYRFVKKNQP